MSDLPTLDAIVAQPEIVKGLPREVIFGLIVKAQAAQLACSMALTDEAPKDELLDVAEAARRIGISPITLSHRAKQEPYVKLLVQTGSRRLRFSALAIRHWQDSQRAEHGR